MALLPWVIFRSDLQWVTEETHWRFSHPRLPSSLGDVEMSHHRISVARRHRVLLLSRRHFFSSMGFHLIAPLQWVLQRIISCLLSHFTKTPSDFYRQTEIFAVLNSAANRWDYSQVQNCKSPRPKDRHSETLLVAHLQVIKQDSGWTDLGQ